MKKMYSVQSDNLSVHFLKGDWFAFIDGRGMQNHTQTAKLKWNIGMLEEITATNA